jgi:hypothetical protein
MIWLLFVILSGAQRRSKDVINCFKLRITQTSFDVISEGAVARATLARPGRFFFV